ncbi:hypothetical protein BX666DRAFT_1953019 [Dichotomocladium elegans]|nr:hypothetical protein BX666DRAFT_1953019 [Dichotomocladium elegans]
MYNNNSTAPIPDSHNFSNARGPTAGTGTAATGASALPPKSAVPKTVRRRSSSSSSSSSSDENDHRGIDHTHTGVDGDTAAATHSKHKPKVGEKIKGNIEKVSGKVTNNPRKVAHGENLAQGNQCP